MFMNLDQKQHFVKLKKKKVFFIFHLTEGKAYFVGGMSADTTPCDMFVELDLETNKWQKLAPLPTPRYATFVFLIKDKMYVLGEL